MTKLFLKLSGVAFILTLLIATGCEDDPVVDPLGPTITFESGDNLVSADVTLGTDVTTIAVRVTADVGDNPLNTLTFLVEGVEVSGANIGDYIKSVTSNGSAITPNNPMLITDANKNGGTWDIEIALFGQVEDQTVNYGFEVADEVGERALVDLDVTLFDPGTPLNNELSGVLLNQAGPAGTGGLDLDTGDGTGSSDAASEIRDLGIDCTIDPANAENWRAQIGTINGANMVKVDPSTLGEGFSFSEVKTTEAIVEAYDAGAALADGVSQNAQCDETAVTDVSDPAVVGDIFSVLSGGKYYLIQIDEVNAISGSNGDNYVISIKY
ncbi:MAG: hypothetical protein MI974_01030 [Chitinophagales bacterium]|nr:hypothetical protein [Chitinophagales bacterium]